MVALGRLAFTDDLAVAHATKANGNGALTCDAWSSSKGVGVGYRGEIRNSDWTKPLRGSGTLS